MRHITEVIEAEILSDGESHDNKSDTLNRLYDQYNDKEKEIVNQTLICLTGWSFDALKKMQTS